MIDLDLIETHKQKFDINSMKNTKKELTLGLRLVSLNFKFQPLKYGKTGEILWPNKLSSQWIEDDDLISDELCISG